MGKINSKLSEKQLEELQKSTRFNKEELRKWYRSFPKNGNLDKTKFQKMYKGFFPSGDPTIFAGYVFDAYDKDKNGKIDFEEFMSALSITTRGELDEKLTWVFSLYDIDDDGFIMQEEMLRIVEAIYKMVGNNTEKLPTDENTPEKRVTKIFSLMDKNNDGKLSMEEFREGSKRDPTILRALNLYDGVV